MQSLDTPSCNMSWNFGPLKKWPETLPNIAWKKFCIAGFNPQAQITVNINVTFSKAIFSCHPDLSLIELATLYKKTTSLSETKHLINSNDWKELFTLYKLNFNESLLNTINVINHLPCNFKFWAATKKLGLNDFSVFRALESIDTSLPLLQEIIKRGLSRQQGIQALEYGLELSLINPKNNDFLLDFSSLSNDFWLKALQKKRFPLTTSNDQSMTEKTKSISWPKNSKALWIRQGDKAGVQIQTTLTSQKDLEKYVSNLNHISNTLSETPEKLWNN